MEKKHISKENIILLSILCKSTLKFHNTFKNKTTKLAKVIYHFHHSMEKEKEEKEEEREREKFTAFFLIQQIQNIYQHFLINQEGYYTCFKNIYVLSRPKFFNRDSQVRNH